MEILQYDFMQRALLAGIVVAVICPAIGLFLVLRRLSMMGDTLAHVSLAGVAVGLISNFNAILTALVFSLLAALGIEKLRQAYSKYAELAIAIMMSTGIGLAIVLINLGKGDIGSLFGYLFGSIIAITKTDLIIITGLGIMVLAALAILFRPMFYIAYDEEGARVAGVPVTTVNLLFSLLTAITIAVAMRVVGTLLVSSLMVLPVAASLQLARSFRGALIISIIVGVMEVLAGLVLSFYLDTAPGGTIVLTGVTFLIIILAFKNLFNGSRLFNGKRGVNNQVN